MFHIAFLQGVNSDVAVMKRASLSCCLKKAVQVREAEQQRAVCADCGQRNAAGISSRGVQGSLWGPAGKGGGTESGCPGLLPWEQRFSVWWENFSEQPLHVYAAALRLCLTAARAVAAGNVGEPC